MRMLFIVSDTLNPSMVSKDEVVVVAVGFRMTVAWAITFSVHWLRLVVALVVGQIQRLLFQLVHSGATGQPLDL